MGNFFARSQEYSITLSDVVPVADGVDTNRRLLDIVTPPAEKPVTCVSSRTEWPKGLVTLQGLGAGDGGHDETPDLTA